jgi:hypothetical protein
MPNEHSIPLNVIGDDDTFSQSVGSTTWLSREVESPRDFLVTSATDLPRRSCDRLSLLHIYIYMWNVP